MPYPKYCLDCDEKFQPAGRYCRYCKKCIKKRSINAKLKTKISKYKLIDRSIQNEQKK